ncbi:MAG: sigma-70 family RNA polymerase sigma factor [Erysipelotrichaceae bacterium]|nr:sigma-70 family RNA polymerase sigma factor [Erysipelotrichaceae bacterium]
MIKSLINKLMSLFKISSTNYYITGNENLLPPLSKEEEDLLVSKYNETGDIDARNQLIEHNLRLVVYVAKRYDTNITNLEDLISIGTIGLIKAINTYKLDKNIKLATYASRCIENEILMHLRKFQRTKLEVSLDEPLKADYDGNELLLQDILQDNGTTIFDEIDYQEDVDNLEVALNVLNEREKEIIEYRYGLNGRDELTQKETAELLGISQSYISRLEKKILKKLHSTIKK